MKTYTVQIYDDDLYGWEDDSVYYESDLNEAKDFVDAVKDSGVRARVIRRIVKEEVVY